MQIEIHGRNLPVTAALREYAAKKFARLERYLARDSTLDVELAVERNPRIADAQVVEGTLVTHGDTIRARHAAPDMYEAIDGLYDRMKRQTMDYHDRHLRGRPHHGMPEAAPVADVADEDETVDEFAENAG